MPQIKVSHLSSEHLIEAPVGKALLDVLLDAGMGIQHACGGFCACTTCQVEVLAGAETGLKPAQEEELERMGAGASSQSFPLRLACQAVVQGDLAVKIVNPD